MAEQLGNRASNQQVAGSKLPVNVCFLNVALLAVGRVLQLDRHSIHWAVFYD